MLKKFRFLFFFQNKNYNTAQNTSLKKFRFKDNVKQRISEPSRNKLHPHQTYTPCIVGYSLSKRFNKTSSARKKKPLFC